MLQAHGWSLVANGTAGEAGCATGAPGQEAIGGGKSLPECQRACVSVGKRFVQYHASTWCVCFASCELTRPTSDYASVANLYHFKQVERRQCGSVPYLCTKDAAAERCAQEGRRLCSLGELTYAGADACAYMWTSSSDSLGYFVGLGRPGCGAHNVLMAEPETYGGVGKFDAACCLDGALSSEEDCFEMRRGGCNNAGALEGITSAEVCQRACAVNGACEYFYLDLDAARCNLCSTKRDQAPKCAASEEACVFGPKCCLGQACSPVQALDDAVLSVANDYLADNDKLANAEAYLLAARLGSSFVHTYRARRSEADFPLDALGAAVERAAAVLAACDNACRHDLAKLRNFGAILFHQLKHLVLLEDGHSERALVHWPRHKLIWDLHKVLVADNDRLNAHSMNVLDGFFAILPTHLMRKGVTGHAPYATMQVQGWWRVGDDIRAAGLLTGTGRAWNVFTGQVGGRGSNQFGQSAMVWGDGFMAVARHEVAHQFDRVVKGTTYGAYNARMAAQFNRIKSSATKNLDWNREMVGNGYFQSNPQEIIASQVGNQYLQSSSTQMRIALERHFSGTSTVALNWFVFNVDMFSEDFVSEKSIFYENEVNGLSTPVCIGLTRNAQGFITEMRIPGCPAIGFLYAGWLVSGTTAVSGYACAPSLLAQDAVCALETRPPTAAPTVPPTPVPTLHMPTSAPTSVTTELVLRWVGRACWRGANFLGRANLDGCKQLMLAAPGCAAPGSLLIYSPYSSYWGCHCIKEERASECTDDVLDPNPNWSRYELKSFDSTPPPEDNGVRTFKFVGGGGCWPGRTALGLASSLREAQQKMLDHPTCSREGSILIHSAYSYAWGCACIPAARAHECTDDSADMNQNWNRYELRFVPRTPRPTKFPTQPAAPPSTAPPTSSPTFKGTPKFVFVKRGAACHGNWKGLSTAGTLERAKQLMLERQDCTSEGSILWYSPYSYAWGVKCTPRVDFEASWECVDGNTNWAGYKLTYEGHSDDICFQKTADTECAYSAELVLGGGGAVASAAECKRDCLADPSCAAFAHARPALAAGSGACSFRGGYHISSRPEAGTDCYTRAACGVRRRRCGDATYECTKAAATALCAAEGFRLCSTNDLLADGPSVCAFMWTSSHNSRGYYIGLGTTGCGTLGQLHSSARGKYDAACCPQTANALHNFEGGARDDDGLGAEYLIAVIVLGVVVFVLVLIIAYLTYRLQKKDGLPAVALQSPLPRLGSVTDTGAKRKLGELSQCLETEQVIITENEIDLSAAPGGVE